MKPNFSFFLTGAFFCISLFASGQPPTTLNGQPVGVVNSAVPFLNFTPDARSAALGDAGVALRDADANAIFWNPSKLVYAKDPAGASVSYTPWLSNLVNDMYFTNLSAYKKIGKDQALGVSLLYFDLGTIDFTNNQGVSIGTFNSREYALTASYSRRLFKNFSMGVNVKYVNSNLAAGSSGTGGSGTIKPGGTAAADIGAYYQNQVRDDVSGRGIGWTYGLMISNIGGKINYGSEQQYHIPTNLRLGGGLTYYIDQSSKFNFILDFNKLMVPTPPIMGTQSGVPFIVAGKDPDRAGAVLGSFADAPGGFSEELKEISISTGAEYWYNDQFAARVGYFNESRDKGNRKYFTAGLGIHLQQRFGVDFAYLLPMNSQSPLANTFRLSLVLKFDGSKRNSEVDEPVESEETTN
ncbi:MAG: type IX secretion system outer membrane channel protein PorV [Bacteroidetes bacterium]|nr:type IX secretion system outer membrane channel protein PorV [Fibrella sp.]